ncbi:MAG: aminoglycoside phosphotransferase family protein [Leptolyngbya sp.]|nr:aminoglycoside phosphotransferase family protein [Candidatus Melainabacteria bacterium]
MSNSDDNYQLLDAIKNAYELSEIEEFESISTDEEELLKREDAQPTEVYRSGFRVLAGGERYFLKRVSNSFEEKPLIASEKFLVWTNDRDLQLAPELRRTVDKETHVVFEDSRYQLFKFVDQNSRKIWMSANVSEADCRLSGATLARLHLAGLEYLDLSLKSVDDQWAGSYLPSVQKAWDAVGERLTGDDAQHKRAAELLQADYSTLSDKLATCLSNLQSEAAGQETAPVENEEILVHGDYHPGNVLLPADDETSKRAYVVDFDHMHMEHPLYDLSYALIMFARSPVEGSGEKTDSLLWQQKFDLHLAESFLDSYFAVVAALPPYSDRVVAFKKSLTSERAARNLTDYLTVSCYLILDWAVEKLVLGPLQFSEVYAELIGVTKRLVLDEPLGNLDEVWSKTLNKYVI